MNQFGKRETAVMKGAAVLMMLIHHLFYRQESLQKCILLLPWEMVVSSIMRKIDSGLCQKSITGGAA